MRIKKKQNVLLSSICQSQIKIWRGCLDYEWITSSV